MGKYDIDCISSTWAASGLFPLPPFLLDEFAQFPSASGFGVPCACAVAFSLSLVVLSFLLIPHTFQTRRDREAERHVGHRPPPSTSSLPILSRAKDSRLGPCVRVCVCVCFCVCMCVYTVFIHTPMSQFWNISIVVILQDAPRWRVTTACNSPRLFPKNCPVGVLIHPHNGWAVAVSGQSDGCWVMVLVLVVGQALSARSAIHRAALCCSALRPFMPAAPPGFPTYHLHTYTHTSMSIH